MVTGKEMPESIFRGNWDQRIHKPEKTLPKRAGFCECPVVRIRIVGGKTVSKDGTFVFLRGRVAA